MKKPHLFLRGTEWQRVRGPKNIFLNTEKNEEEVANQSGDKPQTHPQKAHQKQITYVVWFIYMVFNQRIPNWI